MNNLPTLKFYKNGNISNLQEIFRGIKFTKSYNGSVPCKQRTVWLNEEDNILKDSKFIIWGEVELLLYNYTDFCVYQIHYNKNSHKHKVSRNESCGFVHDYEEELINEVTVS